MTIERALITQSRPHIIAFKAQAMIREEASKGCMPEISNHPVSLEPPFQPLWGIKEKEENTGHWTKETPLQEKDLIRLRIWSSPDEDFDWNQSELFLKQLQAVTFKIGFEATGNNQAIMAAFDC